MEVFRSRAVDYDRWYAAHPALYRSELDAVSRFDCRGGVEVGVGTGRFAAPLGVRVGVDPVREMLKLAPGALELVEAVGEALPLRDKSLPCALLVVTLCFVDNPRAVLREAARVAERVVACIVPRESPWGRLYVEMGAAGHPFYSRARFYTLGEVVEMAGGLRPARVVATLLRPPGGPETEEEAREVSLAEAERAGFACVEFRP
ncbi:methyltransferase domain-containing protein [Pyrobaculum neutrophilum]|uniref:Methyltransferase type 11 n=1 Tax=Pyrobaculum neutrophilum (strain DSM 2338 / JCM 9278 / NBRC 100436 / V24Sta) TaxID=444157 RepID=B1YBH3_PYRNV|nr:methyltransferase domain-containing protein [Pyrobaculum neutrophilum]ACB40775.1 Methyltransferase type 11 [Pyrobaculum neutrophilum V24Sta]